MQYIAIETQIPRDECFYIPYKVRDWLITIFQPIVSIDTVNICF